MGRRKKQPEPENHERWLVSYADFITLLFAFFVVMFASSQSDQAKAAQMSESVRQALEAGGIDNLVASVLGGAPGLKEQGNSQRKGPGGAEQVRTDGEKEGVRDGNGGLVAELQPTMSYLKEQLAEELATGKMELVMQPRGLVVSFREAAFFASGEATVSPGGMGAISKVASAIRNIPNPVRMEGHTDSVPIHTAKYPNNWALSAARSIAMLELFSNRFGIPKGRLSIAAYADNAPVGSNATAEGRARNRRVDIVLLNEVGLRAEPSANGERASPLGPARPAQTGGQPETPATAASE